MLLSPIGSPSRCLLSLSLCSSLPILPCDLTCDYELDLRLPVELILYIAELATAANRRTALSLCLVASWVREAVLPLLYNTVVLQGSSTPAPFVDPYFIFERHLPGPLRHIQQLWADISPEHAPHSLNGCYNLTRIALPLDAAETICRSDVWFDVDFPGVTPCRDFTVLGQSHPMRWAPLTTSLEGRDFLRGLTHLRLLNMCLSHYIPLEYTPNLTHLCIPFFDLHLLSMDGQSNGTEFNALDYILLQPHLRMVVLTLNPRYWRFEHQTLKSWAILAMRKDERLYVVASTRQDATRDWEDARRDWENEASGGDSIWDKAVQVRCKLLARLSRTPTEL